AARDELDRMFKIATQNSAATDDVTRLYLHLERVSRGALTSNEDMRTWVQASKYVGTAAADLGRSVGDVYAALERGRAINTCDGPEACRRAVRLQVSQGAMVIKFAATGGVLSNVAGGLGRQMFDDEMQAIVETAHAFGRKATAHAHGKDGIMAALRAGVDSVEHATFTDPETLALFRRTGAYLVPTMIAPEAAVQQARAGQRPPAVLAKAEEAARIAFAEHVNQFAASGVKIAFGTDTGVSAHGQNATEFKMMVDGGMSPARAIRTATLDAADLLGLADTHGSLAPGKIADITAVAASPLEDVTELERVTFVMRRGVVHKLDGQRQAFPPN
ncbi:MAG TPA: amidohydrolase family protein, partial [Phenylobacterium sp.]|nr:amidohydrolase family protein [Phenylobacterium sp.]